MSVVKLPYYPQIVTVVKETRFGVLEISTPTVYETPLSGKVIVRVDVLESLRELFGDECMASRNSVYTLVSGRTDETSHRKQLAQFYQKYKSVTRFINDVYEYGDGDVPLDTQVSDRIIEVMNDYAVDIMRRFTEAGGKHLVTTHLYIYFKFSPNAEIPDAKGVKVIC